MIRCNHSGQTKQKLVAIAFDIKRDHYQYFQMRECCSKCGCEINPVKFTTNSNLPAFTGKIIGMMVETTWQQVLDK